MVQPISAPFFFFGLAIPFTSGLLPDLQIKLPLQPDAPATSTHLFLF